MANPLIIKLKKIAAWTLSLLLTGLVVVVTVTIGWRPLLGAKSRPLTERQFARTPERLERGRYLVNSVAGCFDCHSEVSKQPPKAGEPPKFSKLGAGRIAINQKGFVLAIPNITPDIETGAGTWTDDQFARAIREGIGHDGRTLFPMMPYEDFRHFSDEDLASVVVYIRSLEPVHNQLPKRQLPFVLKRLINSVPQPIQTPVKEVSGQLQRGEYLAELGGCSYCHTPKDKMGHPLPGMDFAGGSQLEEGLAISANITPDPSGISYYDENLFIKTMRTGHVGARPLKLPMPWWVYRNMTDDDLKAIFAYLRTVKPVQHRVDNDEQATLCKLCNQKHGLGADNHKFLAKR
ncbi:MAG TPA: cytochrome c [Terriglobales bacterium]